MGKLQKLPGMRDLEADDCLSLRSAQDKISELLSAYNYKKVDTPILEPSELFYRKAGNEITSKMYAFTDPGGNLVTLRPEFTSSVVRHCLENNDDPLLPLRVQYGGPVFRYDVSKDWMRQFTQVGIEIIGSSNPLADSEILGLACKGVESLGLEGSTIVLGDVGVYSELLEYLGLSTRCRLFILSHLKDLTNGKRGLTRVKKLALDMGFFNQPHRGKRLKEDIKELINDPGIKSEDMTRTIDFDNLDVKEMSKLRSLLKDILQVPGIGPIGERNPDDVIDRMLDKIKPVDDPSNVDTALELATALAGIKGRPDKAIGKADSLLRSIGLSSYAINRLTTVVDLFRCEETQSTELRIDFGIVRGIDYYSGIIFKITHPCADYQLAGGGRYDGLNQVLGYGDMLPSLGFAYNMEALVHLGSSLREPKFPAKRPGRIFIIPNGPSSYRAAISLAASMRKKGNNVEIEICERSMDKSNAYAISCDANQIISVESNGEKHIYELKS